MEFVYPYHQLVGYYLEASKEFSETEIAVFDRIPKPFDFYLDDMMKETRYSERWKIHYPSGHAV